MTFGSSAPFSVGVEEELFLVDAQTLETVPIAEQVVPMPGARLKRELFACVVEITTPICSNAVEALGELRRLRRQVAGLAEPLGATILASGTHPTARGKGQPLSPDPVYVEVAALLGPEVVRRQLVCGLHVHVGVESEEACLRALEGVLPWLPVVLSLSAASPFADGADSGLRSARAERLAELPNGGAPPVFRTWADWQARTAGLDYRRLHWDARPHPDYGTLEVRIPDQQTDVARSAAFAALIQALVRACADGTGEVYDRRLYSERRARAAAEFPDTAELASVVEPAGRELGSWDVICELFQMPSESERQREIGLPGVVRELADRSLA